MTDRDLLLRHLAKLSFLLQERIEGEKPEIGFLLPDDERWSVLPGEPPSSSIEPFENEITLTSKGAVARFLKGEFIPQVEVEQGEWRFQGDPLYFLKVTEVMFELRSADDS